MHVHVLLNYSIAVHYHTSAILCYLLSTVTYFVCKTLERSELFNVSNCLLSKEKKQTILCILTLYSIIR